MSRNPVALVGGVLGVLALLELPFWQPGWLLFKANRLVQGEAFSAFALSPVFTWGLLGLWLAVAFASLLGLRGRGWLLALFASLALVGALLFVGQGARELAQDAPGSARVSLLGGVWLTLLAYYIVMFGALNESPKRLGLRLALVIPGLLAAALLIAGGTLGELGLARELSSQGENFRAELVRHLALAGTSLLLASSLGVPAAILAARREGVARAVLPGVSLLQTLPSLALFGLMLAPLAHLGQTLTLSGAARLILIFALPVLLLALALWRARGLGEKARALLLAATLLLGLVPLSLLALLLAVVLNALLASLFAASPPPAWPGWDAPLAALGVRGIGSAPALIALTLYALLPIVRNAYTGLKETPKAAIEAGQGMGMSPAQLLRRVELPLALPLIVEGLRASAVLTIGITTVAYLIGAGGLGAFIQRGIDQVVADLILLGAVPIILLALLADGLLRGLGLLLTPPGLRETP